MTGVPGGSPGDMTGTCGTPGDTGDMTRGVLSPRSSSGSWIVGVRVGLSSLSSGTVLPEEDSELGADCEGAEVQSTPGRARVQAQVVYQGIGGGCMGGRKNRKRRS